MSDRDYRNEIIEELLRLGPVAAFFSFTVVRKEEGHDVVMTVIPEIILSEEDSIKVHHHLGEIAAIVRQHFKK